MQLLRYALVCGVLSAAWTPAAEPERRQIGEVILEDVPEWDAALAERLQPYLDTRSAVLMDLADNGRGMLIGTRFGETQQLHMVSRRKGARQQLTFLSEPVRDGAFVPGSRRSDLIFSADTGGNENAQIYHLAQDTNTRTLLTDGKSRNDSPVISSKGKWLAYCSNARNGRDFDIYVHDLSGAGAPRLLYEVEGAYYPIAFSPDEGRLLVMHYISAKETRMFVVDVASGAGQLVTPASPPVYYGAADWVPSGDALVMVSDRGGEFRKLYRLDLAERTWTALTDDLAWDIDELAMDFQSGTLAFTSNEDGYSVLYLQRLDNNVRLRLDTPPGIINGLQFSEAGNAVGFSLERPTAPADAYLVNIQGRGMEQWTVSEAGGLDTEQLLRPELIRYQTFDDVDGKQRTVPAFYWEPEGEGPHPVVIYTHGGPESQFRPTFNTRVQAWVRELGLAVIAPNVRGSTGYGRSFHQLDNGVKREDAIRDIGALLDWIDKQPELDAKRVGIFGGSYGGYMVLGSLVNYPDRFKAAIDYVGVTDFVTFLQNTSEYRRDLRREEYGDERDPEVRKVLEQISPARQADKIEARLFVIHGANDPRVPLSEAEQIVARMRERGRKVWFVNALNEGHGFRKKENADLAAILFAQFWQTELIGE